MEKTEYRLTTGEQQIRKNADDIVDLKLLMAKQVEMEEEDRRRLDKVETKVETLEKKPSKIFDKIIETILVVIVSGIVSYIVGGIA